jgi:hypothetical protein
MKDRKYVLGMLALVMAITTATAAAPVLKFHFTHPMAPGSTETDTYGINNAGAIAGDYVDSAGVQHGMILAGKKVTTFDRTDCPNGAGATAIAGYAINKTNQVAGWCLNASGANVGFVWSKAKKFVDVKIPKATGVQAVGINDKGWIAGDYTDSTGTQHGFLKIGSKVTTLDGPGVVSLSQAWSVNNKGVVTVFGANSAGTYVSFTTADKGKTYKPFHGLGEGTTGTAIHSINNKGDIDATVFDTAGLRHGILLHKGKMYSFDDPAGVGATRADGINDKLVMVGRYSSSSVPNGGWKAVTTP